MITIRTKNTNYLKLAQFLATSLNDLEEPTQIEELRNLWPTMTRAQFNQLKLWAAAHAAGKIQLIKG